MLATKIYIDKWEVESRLAKFGVTIDELKEVANLVLAARNESVSADPLNAKGQLSYIYGTRFLRFLFCNKGWEIQRNENIESVRNPMTGERIIYQNVDVACHKFFSPKAISGKGAASSRIIDSAQGSLFGDTMPPEVVPLSRIHSLNSLVWYFCVSFKDDAVFCELSLPSSIDTGNFNNLFIERIFIQNDNDDETLKVKFDGEPPVEFEPVILRK